MTPFAPAAKLREPIARGSATKMHRPEPIRRFRAPAEIPLCTLPTALARELSHRPGPATPGGGTLSPALAAATAGAAEARQLSAESSPLSSFKSQGVGT